MPKKKKQEQEQTQQQVDAQLVRMGRLVDEMLETRGWKEVVGPMLDQMIMDVVGAKMNGRWKLGALGGRNIDNVTAQNLVWYRQALIEFHQYIYSYIDSAVQAKQRKKDGKTEAVYNIPMIDGPYSGKGIPPQSWTSYSADTDGGISG